MATKTPLSEQKKASEKLYLELHPAYAAEQCIRAEMNSLFGKKVLCRMTTEEWDETYRAVELIQKVRNRHKKSR